MLLGDTPFFPYSYFLYSHWAAKWALEMWWFVLSWVDYFDLSVLRKNNLRFLSPNWWLILVGYCEFLGKYTSSASPKGKKYIICIKKNFFKWRWQASVSFTMDVFMDLGPARRTERQCKGASRWVGVLIKMMQTVQRYWTLDITN